jgi:hypothetical protein
MSNFFSKIRANKPILYLQVFAFVITIANFYALSYYFKKDISYLKGLQKFFENHTIEYIIQGILTFSLFNYFLFGVKKN